MCIYLGNKIGLHYESQEHVFPAALGGIAKLPIGFVSDEFNQMISGLEMDFMRNYVFTIPRTIEGPGKRGKLAEKFHSPSNVSVLVDEKDRQYALGYTIKNKPYKIPHICLNSVTGETLFSFQNDYSENLKSKIENFLNWIKQINWNSVIELDGEMLPDNLILFGTMPRKNGSIRAFIAKNKLNKFTLNLAQVQHIAEGYYNQYNIPHSKKYHATVHAKATLIEDHFRILAKIAINFIALEKGEEFVQDEKFRPIVQWVSEGGKNQFVQFIPKVNLLGTDAIKLPSSSHYIVVSKVHSRMVACICLFSSFTVLVDYGFSFDESFDECGLICDWKNRKEYMLKEYLTTLVETLQSS